MVLIEVKRKKIVQMLSCVEYAIFLEQILL